MQFYVYVYNQVHVVKVVPYDLGSSDAAYAIAERAQAAAETVLRETSPVTGNPGSCARAVLAAARVIEAEGGEVV